MPEEIIPEKVLFIGFIFSDNRETLTILFNDKRLAPPRIKL